MTHARSYQRLRALALLAVLCSTPAWAGVPGAGTDEVGPLTTHIYTLRIPPPVGDTLPPGIGGPGSIFYLFSVLDTGADRLGLSSFDANFLDFFNPVVPFFLDVRLWGSNRIDPVGLGAPLGLVSADALAFDRAYALGSSLIGRVLLVAIVALPLWKGAHHTRHVFIDAGGGDRDPMVASLLYLIAAFGSVMAIVAAVRL